MPLSVLDPPAFASTDNGYVYRCPCCGDPTLHFGDREVTLTRPELSKMAKTAAGIADAATRDGACWTWSLRAKTARQDVTFDLDHLRAPELAELLHAAAAMVELDSILRVQHGAGLRLRFEDREDRAY